MPHFAVGLGSPCCYRAKHSEASFIQRRRVPLPDTGTFRLVSELTVPQWQLSVARVSPPDPGSTPILLLTPGTAAGSAFCSPSPVPNTVKITALNHTY